VNGEVDVALLGFMDESSTSTSFGLCIAVVQVLAAGAWQRLRGMVMTNGVVTVGGYLC
jgi:hypothetical protein